MCEICRKYKCPDGCPNNYTPRGKKRKKESARMRWRFVTVHALGGGGESRDCVLAKKDKSNNEIISKI